MYVLVCTISIFWVYTYDNMYTHICILAVYMLKSSLAPNMLRSGPSPLKSPMRRRAQAPQCSLCSVLGWIPSRTWRLLVGSWGSPLTMATFTMFHSDRYRMGNFTISYRNKWYGNVHALYVLLIVSSTYTVGACSVVLFCEYFHCGWPH